MKSLDLKNMSLSVDFDCASVTSLIIGGKERMQASAPLFQLRLRDRDTNTVILSAYDAECHHIFNDGAAYSVFYDKDGHIYDFLSVRVYLTEEQGNAAWRVSVTCDNNGYFVEWIDFPLLTLPPLVDNHPNALSGRVLLPFNEGVIVSDAHLRQMTDFRHFDPEYPSIGCYPLFPNMMSSQMMAYLWEDAGLYLAAHDPDRSVKSIDFYPDGDGVTMLMRLFCGVDFGQPFEMAYPIIWSAIDERWESATEIYRDWFESVLPPRVKKVIENHDLPEWYEDSPLVVSYPVRGIHDMDEMSPNALFPYVNALPLLDDIRRATDSRLLVLLMHWEGTAPWAPPYVWPPFGGEACFKEFMDALHRKGDMLGVYCSGFGYTIQSNLVESYNMQESYDRDQLSRGMCTSPDGTVGISRICTGQRSGYDICPASEVGRELLIEAYSPLFESGVDYAQILDQNHGGGQYFCYSREHGHPPAPGAWMTKNMQEMLLEWNQKAPHMLFGCESAAAEPFMGNLQFSDNRFELNYLIGTPVPLYAYLYHEYLRNFMGNQVSCHLREDQYTFAYRTAYAFAAGDCMTLVLTPDGKLMDHWGTRDFEHTPDKEKVYRLIANLTRFYREKAKPYLHAGRMIPAHTVECSSLTYDCVYLDRSVTLPAVISTAWVSVDGRRAQILVNPQDVDVVCTLSSKSYTVPALDAILVEF